MNRYNVTVTWLNDTTTTWSNVWLEDKVCAVWAWQGNGDLAFCAPFNQFKKIVKAA